MGFISHHIMPLVINSLKGGGTQAHIHTSQTKLISRNQACTLATGRHIPGLKITWKYTCMKANK